MPERPQKNKNDNGITNRRKKKGKAGRRRNRCQIKVNRPSPGKCPRKGGHYQGRKGTTLSMTASPVSVTSTAPEGTTEVTEPNTNTNSFDTNIIIYAACGAGILIITSLIIVAYCYCRKNRRLKEKAAEAKRVSARCRSNSWHFQAQHRVNSTHQYDEIEGSPPVTPPYGGAYTFLETSSQQPITPGVSPPYFEVEDVIQRQISQVSSKSHSPSMGRVVTREKAVPRDSPGRESIIEKYVLDSILGENRERNIDGSPHLDARKHTSRSQLSVKIDNCTKPQGRPPLPLRKMHSNPVSGTCGVREPVDVSALPLYSRPAPPFMRQTSKTSSKSSQGTRSPQSKRPPLPHHHGSTRSAGGESTIERLVLDTILGENRPSNVDGTPRNRAFTESDTNVPKRNGKEVLRRNISEPGNRAHRVTSVHYTAEPVRDTGHVRSSSFTGQQVKPQPPTPCKRSTHLQVPSLASRQRSTSSDDDTMLVENIVYVGLRNNTPV